MPCRFRDLSHAALCALALSCAQSPHRSAESRIYAAGLEAIGLDCESTDRVMVTTLPSTQAMLMSPGEFQEQLMLGLPDGSLTSEIAAHMIADMAALVEAQRGRQAWGNAGRNPVRRLMASFQLICHAVHEPVLVKVSPVASFADFAQRLFAGDFNGRPSGGNRAFAVWPTADFRWGRHRLPLIRQVASGMICSKRRMASYPSAAEGSPTKALRLETS